MCMKHLSLDRIREPYTLVRVLALLSPQRVRAYNTLTIAWRVKTLLNLSNFRERGALPANSARFQLIHDHVGLASGFGSWTWTHQTFDGTVSCAASNKYYTGAPSSLLDPRHH